MWKTLYKLSVGVALAAVAFAPTAALAQLPPLPPLPVVFRPLPSGLLPSLVPVDHRLPSESAVKPFTLAPSQFPHALTSPALMNYLQSADLQEFGLATAAQLLAIATPEALAMLIVDGDTLTRGITAPTTVATTTTPMTAVTTYTGVTSAIWFATKTLFDQGRMTSGLA
jgi:hypothetical protein